MAVVDSKKKLLGSVEIITQGAINTRGELSKAKAVTRAGVETSQPNANVVQAGNTIFASYPNETQDTMIGNIYNADTPNNFARNVAQYLHYLRKSGVERYMTGFDDQLTLNVFKALQNVVKRSGMQIGIRRVADRQAYRAFVRIPKKGA